MAVSFYVSRSLNINFHVIVYSCQKDKLWTWR